MGRPSRIDAVLARTPDGKPITVADRIITALRNGNYLEPAAAAAGVHKSSVYEWLKVGANANAKLQQPGVNKSALSQHERRCALFSDAVAEAEAAWEADANEQLHRLGTGQITAVTVTEKVQVSDEHPDGKIIERTTKTETLAPNPQVLEWRLMRRFPERYTGRVEVSGPGGEPIPIEVRARNLAEALRDFQAGATAAQQVEGAEA